jgi:acyl-CoA hydrolase
VKQGQLVELVARVIQTGRTSLTVEVELYGEDILTGERALSTRGRIILVALDSDGRPTPVPTLPAAASRQKGTF